MKTEKLTVKGIKELGEFKAVKLNKAGEVVAEAEFQVTSDKDIIAKYADGTEKQMKIDSVRRSWLLIVEEEVAEVEEEVVEMVADSVPEVKEHTEEIAIGSIVENAEGVVGEVTDIVGSLATIGTLDDEFPEKVENLSLATDKTAKIFQGEKAKAEKPKAPKAKKETAPSVSIPPVEGIDSVKTVTAKSYKLVDTVRVNGDTDIVITQYGAYIMDVRVINEFATEDGRVETKEIYKSPKASLKDTLQWMGFSEDQVKAMSKEIRKIRKELQKDAE